MTNQQRGHRGKARARRLQVKVRAKLRTLAACVKIKKEAYPQTSVAGNQSQSGPCRKSKPHIARLRKKGPSRFPHNLLWPPDVASFKISVMALVCRVDNRGIYKEPLPVSRKK